MSICPTDCRLLRAQETDVCRAALFLLSSTAEARRNPPQYSLNGTPTMNCSVWSLNRSASSLLYLALVFIAVPDGRNACTAEPSNPPATKPAGLVMNAGFEDGGEQPGWWARHPREESDASRHVRDTSMAHSGSAGGLMERRGQVARIIDRLVEFVTK